MKKRNELIARLRALELFMALVLHGLDSVKFPDRIPDRALKRAFNRFAGWTIDVIGGVSGVGDRLNSKDYKEWKEEWTYDLGQIRAWMLGGETGGKGVQAVIGKVVDFIDASARPGLSEDQRLAALGKAEEWLGLGDRFVQMAAGATRSSQFALTAGESMRMAGTDKLQASVRLMLGMMDELWTNAFTKDDPTWWTTERRPSLSGKRPAGIEWRFRKERELLGQLMDATKHRLQDDILFSIASAGIGGGMVRGPSVGRSLLPALRPQLSGALVAQGGLVLTKEALLALKKAGIITTTGALSLAALDGGRHMAGAVQDGWQDLQTAVHEHYGDEYRTGGKIDDLTGVRDYRLADLTDRNLLHLIEVKDVASFGLRSQIRNYMLHVRYNPARTVTIVVRENASGVYHLWRKFKFGNTTVSGAKLIKSGRLEVMKLVDGKLLRWKLAKKDLEAIKRLDARLAARAR